MSYIPEQDVSSPKYDERERGTYPVNLLQSILILERGENKSLLENQELKEAIEELLSQNFNPLQQRIMVEFYQNLKSYREIGEELLMNPDIVRHETAVVLRKLRHPKYSNRLKKFIQE
ncbi:MAG: hypothetical protein IJA82_05355 [Clostridia bacterium]|nr:hypothetical protein [Clostridia bacterium]